MSTMNAARLHAVGKEFQVDCIDVPSPESDDVLIKVEACGVVPNLKNVITYLPVWFPDLPMPHFPAIYGLDPAGVVAAVGRHVSGVAVGDRVYVNPGRACGSCTACRAARPTSCASYTFAGYFGFGAGSRQVFDRYPWGGFAEYMIAPATSLVTIPSSLSFEAAARFGYLGTAYSGLRKAHAGPDTSVLINGATGTLGLGAVLLSLALGVPKILAVARNKSLLERLKKLAPGRIETFSTTDGSTTAWAKNLVDGIGVDVAVDALPPGSPASQSLEALKSLAPGGRMIGIGGMKDSLALDPIWIMVNQISYIGSNWFTTGEGQTMAAMAGANTLDLSCLIHRRFALQDINQALEAAVDTTEGGFNNAIVVPTVPDRPSR